MQMTLLHDAAMYSNVKLHKQKQVFEETYSIHAHFHSDLVQVCEFALTIWIETCIIQVYIRVYTILFTFNSRQPDGAGKTTHQVEWCIYYPVA